VSPFETFLSSPSTGNFVLVLSVWMFGAAGWHVVHRSDDEGWSGALQAVKEILIYLKILDSAHVPENPVVVAQLEEAVGVWNRDEELRRKVEERGSTGAGPSEALIVLDERSKERVDRIHAVIDFLWGSEKYQGTSEEVIQLAIWNSLATDVSYGEKRGFLKEWA
jgi:hypothetical protein